MATTVFPPFLSPSPHSRPVTLFPSSYTPPFILAFIIILNLVTFFPRSRIAIQQLFRRFILLSRKTKQFWRHSLLFPGLTYLQQWFVRDSVDVASSGVRTGSIDRSLSSKFNLYYLASAKFSALPIVTVQRSLIVKKKVTRTRQPP